MSRKAIPDAEDQFWLVAHGFSCCLQRGADRYGISQDDADAIIKAIADFKAAKQANSNRHTRSGVTVARKDEARAHAERLMRRARNLMRVNPNISVGDRAAIGLKDRETHPRKRSCPQTPPKLLLDSKTYASHFTSGTHTIRFYDRDLGSRAKAEGAARLELFAELIPPSDPIPLLPKGYRDGPLPYLGSFTRSPMKVRYPTSNVPMRVVYWARWASSTCDTGPLSQPLPAPIEGMDWSKLALPSPTPNEIDAGRVKQTVVITSARRELPDRVEMIDTVRAESSRMLPDKHAA